VTVSELTCIALGILFNIFTFALGCAVGVSMVRNRKDFGNDRDRYKNEGFQYYRDSAN
jgi:hypothetical protein